MALAVMHTTRTRRSVVRQIREAGAHGGLAAKSDRVGSRRRWTYITGSFIGVDAGPFRRGSELGRRTIANDALARAYAQRDGGLSEMKGDVLLQNLERDPRYVEFLKKMRLPL